MLMDRVPGCQKLQMTAKRTTAVRARMLIAKKIYGKSINQYFCVARGSFCSGSQITHRHVKLMSFRRRQTFTRPGRMSF